MNHEQMQAQFNLAQAMAMANFGAGLQGMTGDETAFMGMDLGSEEDYISDEEFQKSLTE